MTLFAGIYSLDRQVAPDQESIDAIKRSISRSSDQVDTWSDERFFIAKVDIGAFGDPGFSIDEAHGVVAVAGEPLIEADFENGRSRHTDLLELSIRLARADTSVLRECDGSFSLCYYNRRNGYFVLATDKVGVRPLYYHVGRQFIAFSSTLRLLETLDGIPKRMDLRAVTERITFSYPLGDRTPYSEIKVLRSGECLRMEGGKLRRSFYFRWEDVESGSGDEDERLRGVYDSLVSAVAARSRRDQVAISYLSGGLDSRSIVSALRSLGKEVLTFTVGSPDLQDVVYAGRFARAIGSRHKVQLLESVGGGYLQDLLELITRSLDDPEWSAESGKPRFPRLVFSGDGGSVGLGHVYMDSALVDRIRTEPVERVVASYLCGRSVSQKVMKARMYECLKNMPVEGMCEEINGIASRDPARRFHIFLLNNDQRRHMHEFYEDIDLNRVEYLLPFYDARILEKVVSGPIDIFLGHRFYHRLLTLFPPDTTSIPWQTYPGHLPCPIAESERYKNQWESSRAVRFGLRNRLLHQAWVAVLRPQFPTAVLRRLIVFYALIAHGMKMRDCSTILKCCVEYQGFFEKAQGKISELPLP